MVNLEQPDSQTALYAADLTKVYNRLVHTEKWHPEDAELGIRQYRNFLGLKLLHPEINFPPSKDIDEVWHAHILFTIDYQIFCDAVFGHFFHHVPADPTQPQEGEVLGEAFKTHTCPLYEKHFGEPLLAVYPIPIGLRAIRLCQWVKRQVHQLLKKIKVLPSQTIEPAL